MTTTRKTAKRPTEALPVGRSQKPDKRAIGGRLKQAREALGLSQRELADKLGAELHTVKNWESGRRIPRGGYAMGYARLGVNLHWVMENEGSMFLEGEARQVQTDLIDSSSGNEAAAERMQRRVDRAMHGFKEAQRLVDEAAARCEYAIPQLVRQAIVLAVMKGMAPDAVDAVTQMLKAQALLDQTGVKKPL